MADYTAHQLIGQANGAGADDALFEAFFTEKLIAELRTIPSVFGMFSKQNGVGHDALKNMYRGKLTGGHKAKGVDIKADAYLNSALQNSKLLVPDDLYLTQSFTALEDLVRSHYDTVSHDLREIAYDISQTYDKYCCQKLVLAAREAAFYTNRPTGTQVTVSDSGTDGSQLEVAIRTAARNLALNNVESEVTLMLLPNYFELLFDAANITNLITLNKDVGAEGSIAHRRVARLHGIKIMEYNHMPSTNIGSITGDNNTYSGDFRETVGVTFDRSALRVGMWVPPSVVVENDKDRHIGKYVRGMMIAGVNYHRPESCIEIVDDNLVV